jgi:hypothetical protein
VLDILQHRQRLKRLAQLVRKLRAIGARHRYNSAWLLRD